MKLVDTGEMKMVNAIMYFAANVKHPYKLKIFKLLYFLDFLHFAQVGRPVTNQLYKAFGMGPVPDKLFDEIEEGSTSDYFAENMSIIKREFDSVEAFEFKPKKKPDMEIFTHREVDLLKEIACVFKDARSKEMSEASHLRNLPWARTKEKKGLYGYIDYLLAIDDNAEIPIELAVERLESNREMQELFSE